MLKKMLLAAALSLGIPNIASADPRVELRIETPEFSVRAGDSRWERKYKRYYDSHEQYRRYPRCRPWEIAVRNPYRYNRYICVDRDVYRDYRRRY